MKEYQLHSYNVFKLKNIILDVFYQKVQKFQFTNLLLNKKIQISLNNRQDICKTNLV